jgi:hypothetical protein
VVPKSSIHKNGHFSRVAMMTGKYPYRVGRQHMYIKPLMPVGLPVNVNIMPQYFKQAK